MTLVGCSSQPSNTTASNSTQVESSPSSNTSENKDSASSNTGSTNASNKSDSSQTVALKDIPAFSDKAYVAINNNVPYFTDSDYTTVSFERYSDLDRLGRCGVAYANIGKDLMPTEERESISSVKPSGWQSVKYDNVDGKYLYNRCHLIGYQLTAENANAKNLITGTRYLNVTGMLPFENMVADYVKETGNHVLYRVTPIYDGNNLVASGVLMEAKSVEDKGEGICFNVYAYNNQPGITINYADGTSHLTANGQAGSSASSNSSNSSSSTSNKNSNQTATSTSASYVLNTNSHKFHLPACSSAPKKDSADRKDVNESREQIIAEGYDPCKKCNP
ncbi:MAG: DNA/RNA non-specific endonuclease [Clostridium sp.]|nr:DNA/RNA non-specific endonuclease [Clostridium sp.]